MFCFNGSNKYQQQGFILITVLIFVFMLGLLALSLLSTANLELRMSKNRIIAAQQFQAAEAGLKIAENRLALLSLRKILVLQEQLNYAGFQISYGIQRYVSSFCFKQKIAYTYHVIAKAKKIAGGALTLKTTYTSIGNERCHGGEIQITKLGRSAWRELNQYYS